jgi:hypothetical protein
LDICACSIDEIVDGLLNFLGCRFDVGQMPDIFLSQVRDFCFGCPDRAQESLDIRFSADILSSGSSALN